jgi:MoaA/NifB/PqqE/SkfB family radical SAM enzyme
MSVEHSPVADMKQQFLQSLNDRPLHLKGLPNELTIELTSRCQLACVTCPRENLFKPLVPNREMPWDLYERIARQYVPHLDFLSLAGGLGEPLLYSRFADAVRLARSLNPRLYLFISTNALLPKTVSILRPLAGLLSAIQVSVDGVGEVFDRIVGRSRAFERFEPIVRELVEVITAGGTKLRFNSVVTLENFGDLDDVVRTVAKWGGDSLYFNGMNLAATNRDLTRYDFYVTRSYVERMEGLVALGAGLGVAVEWHDMRTIKGFSSCPAPWNNFYIGSDGFLVPCCAKPFPQLLNFGHIDDGGLSERINDPGLVEFRRLSVLNSSPDFCKSCGAQYAPRATDGVTDER